jgi:DNA primase
VVAVAARLSQELIDQIRAANDIVDVISERLQVRKAGRNYRALCPFHQEKTPSFNVSPERQIYHCFGCGVGGNVITFLMEYEKLTFPEALRELADRAGIALPRRSDQGAEEDPIYEANRVAARFFRECLAGEAGAEARAYVRTRGLRDETVKALEIGYAPAGWDALLKAAAREGVPSALLEEAGLVVRRDDGGWYDRFRDRLVFPLALPGGRIAGFGGRSLGDQEPKYLNSPETRVYHKGRYLYGLAQARTAIRATREAVLVEGYMDLAALHEAGFTNAVASAGTALTPDQAGAIAKLADKVFVAYDGDAAGTAAAVKAAELLVALGLKVRLLRLPDGADPDSFVRTSGPAAFREALAGALDFIDFVVALHPPRTPEAREAAARSLLETVVRIEDPLKADLMLEKIASVLAIGRSALSRACDARRADLRSARRPAEGGAGPGRTGRDPASLAAQKGLLGLVIAGGDAARRVRAEVSPSDFTDPLLKAMAERVYAAGGAIDIAGLAQGLGREEASLLTEVSMLPADEEDGARLCDDYIRTLRRVVVEAEIRLVDDEIRAAEMTDDEARLLAGVARRQELARRLTDLSVGG